MRRLVGMVSVAVLLGACQQPAVKVSHVAPGTNLQRDMASAGGTLSFFPRWNDGNIEMAQGETAPRPVPYSVASAQTGSRGAAGKEAARYYTANPAPAARIGGAPVTEAPREYAAAQPAPAAPMPFAQASAPAPQPAPLQVASAAPVAAPRTMYAPSPAPAPRATASTPPATQEEANRRFQAMLTGGGVMPVAATGSTAPATATAATNAPATDYAGSFALGSAVPVAAAAPQPAQTQAVQPMNAAAPSLPFQTAAAAKPATPTVSAQPVNFVMNASGESVQAVVDSKSVAQPTSAGAMPVAAVSSAPLAGAPPLVWPVRGTVISAYGPKAGGRSNDGMNISANAGDPIRAAADGMVVYAGNEVPGYGNMVVLSHEGGRSTVYAHAQSLNVARGQFVKQGDTIARVGQTGGVAKPQLHFAVRNGKQPTDPLPLLEGKSSKS